MKKQSAETNSKEPTLARRDFVKTTAAAGGGHVGATNTDPDVG